MVQVGRVGLNKQLYIFLTYSLESLDLPFSIHSCKYVKLFAIKHNVQFTCQIMF